VTSGPGWKPGENVDLKVGGALIKTVQADANGVVDTTVTITRKVLGPVHVTLTGRALGLTALSDFTVTA
jgi:hypothetical protein